MRRIIAGNPLTEHAHKTYLSAQYTSGLTASVLSNVSFQQNDLVIFGELGEEQTELKKLSGLTNKDTLDLASALSFPHHKDTPVYRIPWDFIVFEGRASSADSFEILSESPIQWDTRDTVFYHGAGSGTWEYRFKFYNSSAQIYSEYSPTVSGAGFNRSQVGFMIHRVRKLVKDLTGRIVGDGEIINFFNSAHDIIYARNPEYWFLKVDTKQTNNGIAAVADTAVYSLASYTNFSHLHLLKYRYNNGEIDKIYSLNYKPESEFDQATRDLAKAAEDYPIRYKLLPPDSSSEVGYFQVDPKILNSNVGTFYPVYFKIIPELDSFDDETIVPLPQLLEHYAIMQIEQIKGNEAKAKVYENLFFGPNERRKGFERMEGLALLDEINKFKSRPQGQPRNLIKFMGQRGAARMHGDRRTISSHDDQKEKYF
jgi:hypothetical protein